MFPTFLECHNQGIGAEDHYVSSPLPWGLFDLRQKGNDENKSKKNTVKVKLESFNMQFVRCSKVIKKQP